MTKINNDKNNAIAEINKQITSQGVTTEKDNGIAVLEQDVITPTVKPQAKQDIIQAVTTRKQQIKKSNASLQDEKDVANDKIGKIETKAIKDIDAATTNAQVEAIKTKQSMILIKLHLLQQLKQQLLKNLTKLFKHKLIKHL